MNLMDDYLDVLLNIEMATLSVCDNHQGIQDVHVLAVYEKFHTRFDRRKRGLPDLPVAFKGSVLELFQAIEGKCEVFGMPEISEQLGMEQAVPPHVLVACFKRLIESVKLHSKRAGVKGYIKFIDEQVPRIG